LLLKNKNDEQFLKNLHKVGMYCGDFHIANKIPVDQASLAISILEATGIAMK
jgi:hypothetical protein